MAKDKKKKTSFGKGFKDDQEGVSTGMVYPIGDYPVTIKSAIDETNKAGNGENFAVIYLITKGEYKGREIRRWYAYNNTNEQAVKIAKEHLKSLSDAVEIQFSKIAKVGAKAFEKKKLILTLGLSPAKKDKEAENTITKYTNIKEAKSKGKKGKDKKPSFEE